MSDEPSLPRLPRRTRDQPSQSLEPNPRKRAIAKLNTEANSTYNSSDPAVFSSDDDPGLDNYVDGRRKRRYRGTWFRQLPMSGDSTFGDDDTAPKTQTKRTLARQYDSGIYLGSDATEDEELAEKLPLPAQPRLPQLQAKALPPRPIDPRDLLVQEKIRSAMEQGTETIDLWSLGLTELSNEVMGSLTQFSCVPTVTKGVAFEQKQPEMKLYMAKNLLTRVPGAIFDIEHLTTLSLRGNQLTELPSGVAKLVHLKELNVSQNELRYLPTELLDLLPKKLRSLSIWPNPFWQPDVEIKLTSSEANLSRLKTHTAEIPAGESSEPRLASTHLVSSLVQQTSSSGRVLSKFCLPSLAERSSAGIATGADDGTSHSCSGSQVGRVPSLMEAALLTCYQTADLEDMPGVMPPELSHLGKMLEQASQQRYIGGHVCSNCRKTVIQPLFEWVEWRELFSIRIVSKADGEPPNHIVIPESRLLEEMAVPFLHRSCSRLCGPSSTNTPAER